MFLEMDTGEGQDLPRESEKLIKKGERLERDDEVKLGYYTQRAHNSIHERAQLVRGASL